MILHLVNKSPFSHDTLASCLRLMSPTDSLLLLADGVYGATYQAVKLPALAERLKNKLTASRCYALQADVAMRAIEHHLVPDLQLIDDADFVKLSIAHQRTQSWN